MSNKYSLKAQMYIENQNENMQYFYSPVELTLDVNIAKTRVRRIKTLSLSQYDSYEDKWIPVKNGNKNDFAIKALVDKLGEFAIIGDRK